MQKQPNRLWLTALFIGWCFDFLFYEQSPGISFAIYVIVTLAAGFFLLRQDGILPARRTLILLPFILFFAAMTFIRQEPLSVFLAHALTLFLMAGLVVTYRGGEWLRYSLADYFSRGLDLLGSAVARPIGFAAESQRLKSETGEVKKGPNPVWPVLRGLLFAVPVVAFFAALLSSADMIFAQRLGSLVTLFRLENLPEYIFRVMYICVLGYIVAGVFLHAARRSGDEKLLGLEKPVVPPFLGFTEASMVLGSVVLLFALFVAIQFQYFFGGQVNIQLDGYTYADYARKGFGELVTVAFFALILFLGLSSITRRELLRQTRIFSGLGVALLALVGVMLVSAYQRLVLYESAYGFTRLRTYTHVFMIWIALLLAGVVLLELVRRQRVFALAALIASVGFALSLTVMNVDGFIFQRNVTSFELGNDLDVGYLASLSADAVPDMVSLYQSQPAKSELRDRVGAALACMMHAETTRQVYPAWQSFHLSEYRAALALKSITEALKTYKVDDSNWPVTVMTPLGEKFDCYSPVSD